MRSEKEAPPPVGSGKGRKAEIERVDRLKIDKTTETDGGQVGTTRPTMVPLYDRKFSGYNWLDPISVDAVKRWLESYSRWAYHWNACEVDLSLPHSPEWKDGGLVSEFDIGGHDLLPIIERTTSRLIVIKLHGWGGRWIKPELSVPLFRPADFSMVVAAGIEKVKGPEIGFADWIRDQVVTDDATGDFIADAREDSQFPTDLASLGDLVWYLHQRNACGPAIVQARVLWRRYKASVARS